MIPVVMENGTYSSCSDASSVSSIATSDDVEVKKLKDLVKKLEKQNEHLRNRTGRLSSSTNKLPRPHTEQAIAGGDACSNFSLLKSTNGYTDDANDIALLTEDDPIVRSVVDGDEFSWLYQSPKARTDVTEKYYASPQDWLKEEFEHPSTPQLASAKKNIMYKLGSIPSDRESPDLGYLKQTLERRLVFHPDDYKMEDETDVKVVARLQQEELKKESEVQLLRNNFADSPVVSRSIRRGSHGDEVDGSSSSSGSPHHTHHLPVPSQTMTTAHGLYPAPFDSDSVTRSRSSRSRTPTRNNERSISSSSGTGLSPRARSPAHKSPGRRSLPTPSRTTNTYGKSSMSISSSSPADLRGSGDRIQSQTNAYQPVIKSSLVAPSRLSKLQPKSSLPAPAASSGIPTGGRNIPAPKTASPMTRRSLPRPSQTSTSMRYIGKPSSRNAPAPERTNPPPADIWGDDDDVY